jgi:hypothetical protein
MIAHGITGERQSITASRSSNVAALGRNSGGAVRSRNSGEQEDK